MRLPACVVLLGLVTAGCATPVVVERELFSLKLPAGWHEGKSTFPDVTIVGEENLPRIPTARFIAATRDCGCIISAIVRSDSLSTEKYYEIYSAYAPGGATVLKSTALTEFGGHHGSGTRRLIQNPYPIATATHVFTFIENDVVCTLLTSASSADPAAAEKILERRLPEVEALAASLKLKAPAK